jgi:16S rRNA pseudouridine516 synthase
MEPMRCHGVILDVRVTWKILSRDGTPSRVGRVQAGRRAPDATLCGMRVSQTLSQILFSQGFGNRRESLALILDGVVAVHGQTVDDPDAEFNTQDLSFTVKGRSWVFREQALVMLHKPTGFECSTKPRHHPSVLSLLAPPLRKRGVQPIGRLDEDTTGLLLFTDDGNLIHRLTSPKHHVPKVYEVGAKHPVSDEQIAQLLAGVVLDDSPVPVRAAAVERRSEDTIALTLTEGKYHQVKRMLAAVGNRVETLHRSRFGELQLPADLAPGEWRWITVSDIGPCA